MKYPIEKHLRRKFHTVTDEDSCVPETIIKFVFVSSLNFFHVELLDFGVRIL